MVVRKRASGSRDGHAKRVAARDAKPVTQAYIGAIRGQLADLQRARIIGAMFDVAVELGAGSVSVADVVERSGVSRRTFYEAFSDREDCFTAAFEDALGIASRRVLSAYRAECGWRDRIRATVIAFLSFLDEEPVVARLLIHESLAGGARTRVRREEVLVQIASAIDKGREESGRAVAIPAPLTAEGLVGGVLSILDARLSSSGGSSMVGLANALVSMIVLPYLGPVAARRELERPVESRVSTAGGKSDRRDARLLEDPFKSMGMRLTYRTVRVLLAVSELGVREPGPSNRVIGETAGISDQGQISKLLGRLQRLGLISNTGLGPGQGAPNAWALTVKGHQITNSIRTHTQDHHG